MVKLQQTKGISNPSSSLGIMRFFDVESGGPKLTPQMVVGITIVFLIAAIALRFVFGA